MELSLLLRHHELRSPQTMKTLRSPSSGNALADEGYEHFQIRQCYRTFLVVHRFLHQFNLRYLWTIGRLSRYEST